MARAPSVQRQAVAAGLPYASYREALREDFFHACCYCTLTEFEAPGGWQIDHYHPSPPAPLARDAYDNLVWCCDRCNREKSDIVVPNMTQAGSPRYFRPDWEHELDHFAVDDDGGVAGVTPIGIFTVEVLNLDRRPGMRELRQLRNEWVQHQALAKQARAGLRALQQVGVDDIDGALRAQFLRVRGALEARAEHAELLSASICRAIGRSALTDRRPDTAGNAVRRRYLASVGALRLSAPTTAGKASAGRKGRGRSRKRSR